MKAISLHQPWATAVAIGAKKFETRSWSTSHLGPLTIHAAKKKSKSQRQMFALFMEHDVISLYFRDAGITTFEQLPFGALIATTNVNFCATTNLLKPDPTEALLGDFSEDRYAWRLEDPKRFEKPVPYKGHQGFFNVPISISECGTKIHVPPSLLPLDPLPSLRPLRPL
jgi:hypothetical protein